MRPAGGHPDPVPLPQSQAGSPFFFISHNFFRDQRLKYQLKYRMASILVVLCISFIHKIIFCVAAYFLHIFRMMSPLILEQHLGGLRERWELDQNNFTTKWKTCCKNSQWNDTPKIAKSPVMFSLSCRFDYKIMQPKGIFSSDMYIK